MRDLSMIKVEIAPPLMWALAALLLIICPARTEAFRLDTRWATTATPGGIAAQGAPAIVTWSIVPDGTDIPGAPWLRPSESNDPSNLIDFLDGLYGVGEGTTLAERPWFPIFESAANRWSELSGLTLVYEPHDDGVAMYATHFNTTITDGPAGILGVRGDIRIGGHYIDGQQDANSLAYALFPGGGEIVIDTSNVDFYGNTADNSRAVRNVIMHELGHSIGIRHMESSNAAFLMEPYITTEFDGPQFDDILAVHRWYGDVYEKSNGLAGNNTATNATFLGSFAGPGMLSVGSDAGSAIVSPTAVDFVSIDDDADIDFYRFTLTHPGMISLTLTPHGPTYMEGPEGGPQTSFAAALQSDLSLALFGADGMTELAAANEHGLGGIEELHLVLTTPGDYFVKISGSDNEVQLYELNVDFAFVPGDVNLDGVFDLSGTPQTDDLLAFVDGWRSVLPTDDYATAWMKGDLNLDGVSDLRDAFLMRQAVIGAGGGHLLGALANLDSVTVPEPKTIILWAILLAGGCYSGCRKTTPATVAA